MKRLPFEAEAFFEEGRESFIREALRLSSSYISNEEPFEQAILGYYDSLYSDTTPCPSALLDSLDGKEFLQETIFVKLGWYLVSKSKNEPWLDVLVKAWDERIKNEFAPKDAKCGPQATPLKENGNFFSHDHIISNFSRIQKEGMSLIFLNLYMGVPIRGEATVLRVDGDEVTFRTNPLQELAIMHDNKAYILQNNVLSKPVKADVVYSNISQNEITLRNFVYLLNLPASMRETTRVHPRRTTPVVIVDMQNRIGVEGIMFDISTGGLGVLSKNNDGIVEGAKIDIFFDLKEEKVSIETEGEILDVIEYEDAYRFCIRFLPKDPNMQEAINNYVQTREKETIKALSKELEEYTK